MSVSVKLPGNAIDFSADARLASAAGTAPPSAS
jgi:hypothetical protein